MSVNTFLPPSITEPISLIITNITVANPMVITVAIPNDYVVAQLVHLTVPASYGMFQADQLNAEILAINGLDFTVSINSLTFDPFVIPPTYQARPASLSPDGSRNIYNISTVPFRSAGNFGN